MGTATGDLGGAGFSGASFVITAQADTGNIGPWCCSPMQNTHSSATVDLAGFGTFSFSGATHTWIAPNCCLGFGANLAANYLTLFSPAIVSVGYGLATNIGPIVDATASTQGQFVSVATSGGALTFSQLGPVTFQATTVPEASASVLMALGLAGIVLATRRRKASAA